MEREWEVVVAVMTSLGGFLVQLMTEQDARRVAAWRYDGRRSVYDLASAQPILDDLVNHFAVTSGKRGETTVTRNPPRTTDDGPFSC